MLTYTRTSLIIFTAALLGACANAGIGLSIPIGPFGSVGIGVNSAGQISGNVGIGTSVGGVGIGGGTSFPIGTVAAPAPAPVNSSTQATQQTGASQNVPR
jgi:hypothetical protein